MISRRTETLQFGVGGVVVEQIDALALYVHQKLTTIQISNQVHVHLIEVPECLIIEGWKPLLLIENHPDR